MNGVRTLGWFIAIGWLALSTPSITPGEPFLPQQDAQVLERLSVKSTDPVAREIKALRASLLYDPQNMDVAVSLATKLIEQSRSEGDPRFLGQAQAVLVPWLNHATPPSSILLLRAAIRQNSHEFDLALADLDAVLKMQPANAQAWLTRASIYQVRGRYEEARRACQTKQWLAGAPSFFVSPPDLIDRCPSEPGLSIRGLHLQDGVKVGEGEIELMRILAYSCSQ